MLGSAASTSHSTTPTVHVPSPLQQCYTEPCLNVDGSEEEGLSDCPPSMRQTSDTSSRRRRLPTRPGPICAAPLVGQYEQCLLTGRLACPMRSQSFQAQVGVIGLDGTSANQIRIPFEAHFAAPIGDPCAQVTAPYTGKVDLEGYFTQQLHSAYKETVQRIHLLREQRGEPQVRASTSVPSTVSCQQEMCMTPRAPVSCSLDTSCIPSEGASWSLPSPPAFPGYRVPRTGKVQLVLRGPSAFPRVLVVPYDVHRLSPGNQCIVRHTCYANPIPPHRGQPSLRYAVQLRFAAPPLNKRCRMDNARFLDAAPRPKVYLFASIRLAFAPLLGSGASPQAATDDGAQLVRKTQTWGLERQPFSSSPWDMPMDHFVGPVEQVLDTPDLVSRFDSAAPRTSHLGPSRDQSTLLPTVMSSQEDLDSQAFHYGGPKDEWTRCFNRARSALRKLREQLLANEQICPQPRSPVGEPAHGPGERLESSIPEPTPPMGSFVATPATTQGAPLPKTLRSVPTHLLGEPFAVSQKSTFQDPLAGREEKSCSSLASQPLHDGPLPLQSPPVQTDRNTHTTYGFQAEEPQPQSHAIVPLPIDLTKLRRARGDGEPAAEEDQVAR